MNVYFLRPGSIRRVKIGWASDLSRRKTELQTGCPVRLSVIGVLECGSLELAKIAEGRLHDAFRRSHTWGEWFRLGDLERLAIHQVLTGDAAIFDRIEGARRLLAISDEEGQARRRQIKTDRKNRKEDRLHARNEARINAMTM